MRAVLLVLCAAAANKAPETAPVLPAGWCEHGTPTATTGECMCAGTRCLGEGCVNQQGMSWYTLACADCACEAPAPRPPPREPAPPVAAAPPPRAEREPKPLRRRAAPQIDDDATIFDHAFEWIDENGHAVLACLFVVALVCVFLPALVLKSVDSASAAGAEAGSKRQPSRGLRFRAQRPRGPSHVV
jgi:hypothetical protein